MITSSSNIYIYIRTAVQHATLGIAKIGFLGKNVAAKEQRTIKTKQIIARFVCTSTEESSLTATTPTFKHVAEIIQPGCT